MKLTSKRDGLLGACQAVAVAVPVRSPREILSHVKAVAADDALTLTAFDTEVGIRYELRGVTVRRVGAAILPITQLTQILKESTAEEVDIDAQAEGTTIRVGAGRFVLPARPVDEFPDIPAFDDGGRYHEVTAGVLRSLIRRTAFAADKKDSGGRFALKGVLWEAEGRVARLVATDTKRLALCEGPANLYGPPEPAKTAHLVPPKAIALLERNLLDDGELVRVGLRANDAQFQTDRALIYTTLVQGRFPPYRDILTQTRKAAATPIPLPVDGFLSALRQVAVVTDEESKRVDLAFEPGRLILRARGAETGSGEVELALPDYSGPAVGIAFDPSFLIEFLRVLDGEEPAVTLEVTGPDKPAVFRCGEAYTYVVMPLAG